MAVERQPCMIPEALVRLQYPLTALARQLRGEAPIRIVAIGSSSTAGRPEVLPYPYRLEFELRKTFPGKKIDVLNRGMGGEEAPKEFARFATDVFAEKPALVIWQVGTNAVFHGDDLDDVVFKIHCGLEQLGANSLDVVLVDPQYVPAMLTDARIQATRRIVSRIATEAVDGEVNLFRRFALMESWHQQQGIMPEDMIDRSDPDLLHQNDWSTRCVAKALADAIAAAAR